MILLVDADILLFRMCFSHEKTIDWGDGVESKVTELDQATDRIESMVNKMEKFCHCTHSIFCFTSKDNFRFNVYPEYKANRQKQSFEMIGDLRAWMTETYNVKYMPKLEADDVMGILSTKSPDKYVIASIDKDLKQIPGRHYNWDTNRRTIVSRESADTFFYRQILTGDTTDNYKGVPGVGKKRALKLLKENDRTEWWDAIVEAYAAKDLTEEYALQMARVARILRVEDYNFETKEPILWKPEKEI